MKIDSEISNATSLGIDFAISLRNFGTIASVVDRSIGYFVLSFHTLRPSFIVFNVILSHPPLFLRHCSQEKRSLETERKPRIYVRIHESVCTRTHTWEYIIYILYIIFIYLYIYIYVCVCIYIYIYIYTHTHAHTHIYIYIYIGECIKK